MGYKSKETSVSKDVLAQIESYKKDHHRYRSDALRELVSLGINNIPEHDIEAVNLDGHNQRLVLGVTEEMESKVEHFRRLLPDNMATYEIAYREVLFLGLDALRKKNEVRDL